MQIEIELIENAGGTMSYVHIEYIFKKNDLNAFDNKLYSLPLVPKRHLGLGSTQVPIYMRQTIHMSRHLPT